MAAWALAAASVSTATPAGRIIYPAGHAPVMALPGGGRPVTSLLRIPGRLRFGEYRWNERGADTGQAWVRVDLAHQMVSVFRGGDEIGTSVILYGGDGKPTPVGRFHVLERAARHHSAAYDADMPFMLRLTADGVAIHASSVRQGYATHGCIGVPPAFARRLFAAMKRGDSVYILP